MAVSRVSGDHFNISKSNVLYTLYIHNFHYIGAYKHVVFSLQSTADIDIFMYTE